MTAAALLAFMRRYRVAAEASVSPDGGAQAAVVGIAVTDRFEIVFDTLSTSRKARNVRGNSKIALVIGGFSEGDERTVQYEGLADEPTGDDLERVKRAYYEVYPDGPSRLTWPGLIYFRVRPAWVRYSDFSADPPVIVEFTAADLIA